jgi:hypothetical protein
MSQPGGGTAKLRYCHGQPYGFPVTATRRFTAQASPVADSPWVDPLARGVFDKTHNHLVSSACQLVIEATYQF